MVSADDFELVERTVAELSEGQVVVVGNLYLSCDPTQRGWIGRDTYLPAVKIGDVMRSVAAGEVVESRDSRFDPGPLVQGKLGWKDLAVAEPGVAALSPLLPGIPIEACLGAGVDGQSKTTFRYTV